MPTVEPTSEPNGIVTRSEVLQRAQFWVAQRVHYRSTDGRFPLVAADPAGRPYRTDCSGFVCMAWHCGSEPSTAQFDSIGHQIDREQLLAGDALLWKGIGGYGVDGGHVVLFVGWTGSDHRSYLAYELRGGRAAQQSVIPYPYHDNNNRYVPWRYHRVVEDRPS